MMRYRVALAAAMLVSVLSTAAYGALPRGYTVQRVDSPNPTVGGNFGIGFVNAGDLNGDGADDLLVGTDEHGGSDGQVFTISGKDGKPIRTIDPPDASTRGTKASFGSYVGKLGDITGDGAPELLITALGVDVGASQDQGRAYVYNGATGALIKRLDMPQTDAATQIGRRPAFGRTILSLGNVVGDSRPDIYVGASDFYDTPATNPACSPGPCLQAGRAYVYDGAGITGDPNVPFSTPTYTIKNPLAQTDDLFTPVNTNRESMGYSVAPVGDVGSCKAPAGFVCPTASSSGFSDGYPDFALSDHRLDMFGMFDVGAVLLVDGRSGAIMYVYTHPEPQPASIFGFTNYNQPAIGDVGASTAPDIYQPAMRQNGVHTGEGSGYVLNGQFKQAGSPNGISFATFRDPTPQPSGDFGTSSAGIGNVAGDSRNEILIGAYGPHNPGTHTGVIGDAWIFSALTERALQRFRDPDNQSGDGFGAALQPLGDVNGDRLLDFAIGAGLWDGPVGTDQGRIFILRSVAQVRKSIKGTVLAPAYLEYKP